MPLYRVTTPGALPFLTWGRTIDEAVASYAQQVHGPGVLVRRLEDGAWQCFAPTSDPRVVEPRGEPFTVVEDEPC